MYIVHIVLHTVTASTTICQYCMDKSLKGYPESEVEVDGPGWLEKTPVREKGNAESEWEVDAGCGRLGKTPAEEKRCAESE